MPSRKNNVNLKNKGGVTHSETVGLDHGRPPFSAIPSDSQSQTLFPDWKAIGLIAALSILSLALILLGLIGYRMTAHR